MTSFLKTSFEILRLEFPAAYRLLCSQLTPRTVQMLIDDESIALAFDPAGVHIMPQLRHPTLEIYTTRKTLLAVIDARLRLYETIMQDVFQMKGRVEDLAAFHDGLLTYVRGAVRSPSFPALLDHFRYASSDLLSRNHKADARQ